MHQRQWEVIAVVDVVKHFLEKVYIQFPIIKKLKKSTKLLYAKSDHLKAANVGHA